MTTEEELNASQDPTDTVEADGAALDSITAGYNRQRGIEPEPETATPAEPAPAPEPVAETPPEPPQPTVEEKLAALQQSLSDLNGTPASVRKIYGELGSIKQALKEIREAKPTAAAGEPAQPTPEWAAVIAEVDRSASDFPDLVGPLANAIKALGKQAASAPAAAPAAPLTDEEFNARYEKRKQAEAVAELTEEHPDFESVRETPEYKEWLKTLEDGYRTRFIKTWNPTVVSKGLTEFKTWRAAAQAARTEKDNRLKSAITPAGEGAPGPSQLPDSAGISVGYNKVRRLRTAA
jgi:hypothetical protein